MLKKLLYSRDYGLWIDSFLLILRIASGILMLTHGIPKVEKVFAGNFKFANPIGLGQEASLILTAFAEACCSTLVIAGIAIRFAVIPIIIVMLVALFIVHAGESIFGHWNILGYLASYLTFLILGGGKYSFDHKWRSIDS